MNISLKQEQEQFIKDKVNSRKYATADEVITEALHLLDERDKRYQQWLDDTRQKVAVGLAQLDKGEGIEMQTVITNLKNRINSAKEKTE